MRTISGTNIMNSPSSFPPFLPDRGREEHRSAVYLTPWERFIKWFRQRFVASPSPSTPLLTDSSKEKNQSAEMPSVGKKLLRWMRQEDAGYSCPECHSDLRKDQKYCSNCGADIDWDEVS